MSNTKNKLISNKKIFVCTLFEKTYHYGVAALVNSLYKNGFRGSVYIGYRGILPFWAEESRPNPDLNWNEGCTLSIKDELYIHFLPVKTNYHLTNYKPEFMLELLKGPAKGCEGLLYFDPDIVIRCRWSFFEEWIDFGVALVHEVVTNDLPSTHPTRSKWELSINSINKTVKRQITSYINGGFCGVQIRNIEFLYIWQKLIQHAIDNDNDPTQFLSVDKTDSFWSIDQDSLNATAMCCECPISEVGPDGMDFIYGGWIMSHATGHPKPWNKKFLLSFLKGRPPILADKQFWLNTTTPILLYSSFFVKFKLINISISNFLGRFYRRF